MATTLTTERLQLRPPEARDAGDIARLIGDFEVCGNLSRVPYPYRLSDAKIWLASRPADPEPQQMAFAIDIIGEGFGGTTGFHPDNDDIALGYWVGKPYWGRGIATEAAEAVLRWYFDVTPANAVRSGVFHFNAASLAIQRKLGFVVTGRSVRHCLARGEDIEHVDTVLTRDTFSELWAERSGRNEKIVQ